MAKSDGELREEVLQAVRTGVQTRDHLGSLSSTGLSRILAVIRREREAGFREGAEAMADRVLNGFWKPKKGSPAYEGCKKALAELTGTGPEGRVE